eukprot:6175437-Pleurochrysis_carterae.AAC.2
MCGSVVGAQWPRALTWPRCCLAVLVCAALPRAERAREVARAGVPFYPDRCFSFCVLLLYFLGSKTLGTWTYTIGDGSLVQNAISNQHGHHLDVPLITKIFQTAHCHTDSRHE